MVMMTTSPGEVGVSVGRWSQAKCQTGKRLLDVNLQDAQVRVWCERCRLHHIYDLGVSGARAPGFYDQGAL